MHTHGGYGYRRHEWQKLSDNSMKFLFELDCRLIFSRLGYDLPIYQLMDLQEKLICQENNRFCHETLFQN